MKFPCIREKMSFCTKHLTFTDTKSTYFKFSQLNDLDQCGTILIFQKPLVFHFVKLNSFYEMSLNEGKDVLFYTEHVACAGTKSTYFKFSRLTYLE